MVVLEPQSSQVRRGKVDESRRARFFEVLKSTSQKVALAPMVGVSAKHVFGRAVLVVEGVGQLGGGVVS